MNDQISGIENQSDDVRRKEKAQADCIWNRGGENISEGKHKIPGGYKR